MRTVGDWDVLADLGSARETYINKVTGASQKHMPDELIVRAFRLGGQHRFFSLRPHLRAGEVCGVCSGTGRLVDDSCHACNGTGRELREAYSDAVDNEEQLWTRGTMWQQEILPDDSAFVLHGFMTSAEALDIMAQADRFGYRTCQYNWRVWGSVFVTGGSLADVLFARARPHLEDVVIADDGQRPKGIPDHAQSGTWVPVGFKPCFEVCRYKPGCFFLPHMDAAYDEKGEHTWDESLDLMSFKTFVAYLNDVESLAGGSTSFYKDAQTHYVEPNPEKVVASVQPECGSCLVFNHALTHDGGKLEHGLKLILRTDVMYQLQK